MNGDCVKDDAAALRDWNPSKLIKALYEVGIRQKKIIQLCLVIQVSYEPKVQTKRNRFLNMEGHVEVHKYLYSQPLIFHFPPAPIAFGIMSKIGRINEKMSIVWLNLVNTKANIESSTIKRNTKIYKCLFSPNLEYCDLLEFLRTTLINFLCRCLRTTRIIRLNWIRNGNRFTSERRKAGFRLSL